jgi:hypothetical protein
MEELKSTMDGRLKPNKNLCGELEITVLINADGSVHDIQFPSKISGTHIDPSGMLETTFRQSLETVRFAPVPEVVQGSPQFKHFILGSRYVRACNVK